MGQPLTKFTNGQIQVSVWENEGAKGLYRTFKVGRRYRDPKTGEWRDSGSFFQSEMETLLDLLKQTADFLEKEPPAPDGQGGAHGKRPSGHMARV